MIVLVVTGSREADVAACTEMINAICDSIGCTSIWHGAHPKGADKAAAMVASARKLTTLEWPADWNRLGNGAGPIRNQAMMEAAMKQSQAYVLAMPANGAENKGTLDAIRAAIALHLILLVRWVPRERIKSKTTS